ncbi:MAG: hypothetical protein M1838_005937 [Thelocarpon superellum]|nr:MAG: hypothetical protein M1838_005937 [Thelocarpon superellum]
MSPFQGERGSSSSPPRGLREAYERIVDEENLAAEESALDGASDTQDGPQMDWTTYHYTYPDRSRDQDLLRVNRIAHSPSPVLSQARSRRSPLSFREAGNNSPDVRPQDVDRDVPDYTSDSNLSGFSSLENGTEDSFARKLAAHARDQQRVSQALKTNGGIFSKARPSERAGLTTENLRRRERSDPARSPVLDNGIKDGSVTSDRSDPPLRIPPAWGRKGRRDNKWLSRIRDTESVPAAVPAVSTSPAKESENTRGPSLIPRARSDLGRTPRSTGTEVVVTDSKIPVSPIKKRGESNPPPAPPPEREDARMEKTGHVSVETPTEHIASRGDVALPKEATPKGPTKPFLAQTPHLGVGGWVDTPGKTEHKPAPAPVMAKTAKTAPTTTASARLTRLKQELEMDTTVDSLDELIAKEPDATSSMMLGEADDKIETLAAPTTQTTHDRDDDTDPLDFRDANGGPLTQAERAARLEELAHERMNDRLRKLRLSLRDAQTGIAGLERQVEDRAAAAAAAAASATTAASVWACPECGSLVAIAPAPHSHAWPFRNPLPPTYTWRGNWPRLTWFGTVLLLFCLYQLSEFTICELYCHKTYAVSYAGYGVDIYAPRPPFVTYQFLRRRLPWLLRPTEALVRYYARLMLWGAEALFRAVFPSSFLSSSSASSGAASTYTALTASTPAQAAAAAADSTATAAAAAASSVAGVMGAFFAELFSFPSSSSLSGGHTPSSYSQYAAGAGGGRQGDGKGDGEGRTSYTYDYDDTGGIGDDEIIR